AWRIRRAGIGPLGGSRQLREGRPTWLRVLPLMAGTGTMLLATTAVETGLLPSGVVGPLLILGFVTICLGIVIIGPWATYQFSRLVSRAARSAEAVIACSRILATPAATFRSVGGLVVAVFLVSVFAGSASVVGQQVTPRQEPGLMPLEMLTVSGDNVDLPATIEALEGTEGVTGVIQGYATNPDSEVSGMVAVSRTDALALGFEDVPDAAWVAFQPSAFTAAEQNGVPEVVAADPADVRETYRLYIATDGSPEAIERARTTLDVSTGISIIAMTRAHLADFGTTRLVNSLAVLAYLGIFFSVTIAGISLAVATVAAMLDRKRVLGLMRLMGMPSRSIRRIIGMEAAVPLLAVLGGSVGLGFLVAWMIITRLGNGDYAMGWPDPLYFATLAVSLVLAVLSISAGAATVNRNTSVAATRFE
ncbi:MAG TPA: ABC transporter permease, partial [Thermomicrobiales bacterium]|nr:ABC transporter permease [Thermomicrobiales bacterium]